MGGFILALLAGAVIGAGITGMCMSAKYGDTAGRSLAQAREIQNLESENEYMHMHLAEIWDKVVQMEPQEGSSSEYRRAYEDMLEEIRRVAQ